MKGNGTFLKTWSLFARKSVHVFLAALLGATMIYAATFTNTTAAAKEAGQDDPDAKGAPMTDKVVKTEEEWKQVLSPEAYCVLREKGTERAFTGKYYLNKETGVYHCAACGAPLFSSEHKYESGSGWPSYFKPISDDAVRLQEDNSHFMKRTEALCGRCGSHLGHVFDDGPRPTGKRYCINSISLEFKLKE